MAQPTSTTRTPLNPATLTRSTARKAPADHVNELKTLVVDYAKQETVEPLKALGRYLGFGMSGSLLIGAGLSMMLLGLLRALEHVGYFVRRAAEHGGRWSFLPYLITIAAGLAVIAVAGVTIKKKTVPKRIQP